MAAPAPGSPELGPPPSNQRNNQDRLEGLVRALRKDVQDFKLSLVALRDADPASPSINGLLVQADTVRRLDDERIQAHQANLAVLLNADASLFSYCGDVIEQITTQWSRVDMIWPGPADPAIALKQVGPLLALTGELIYAAGMITIPARVNQHLNTCWVGQTLDFHEQFGDELDDPTLEKRMLEYLHSHPLSVAGEVDLDSGLIYCASPHLWRRFVSYLLILGTTLLGALVFYFYLPTASWIPNWPTASGTVLLVAYVMAILGSLLHLVVDTMKKVRAARGTASPTYFALSDLLIWAHISEVYICFGIVGVAVAAFGVIDITHHTDQFTMLLAGYSWDSLQDIIIPRFQKMVSSQSEALAKQVA